MPRLIPTLVLALALAAASCDGDGGGAPADATPDAAPDATPDAAGDTPGLPDAAGLLDGAGLADGGGPADAPPPSDVPFDGPPDVPADAPPPRDVPVAIPCDPSPRYGAPFDLLPDAPLPQLHPDLAFDGHALWLAWNQGEPEDDGFDVWAARLACDGAPSVPPFHAQAADDGNDLTPTLAVQDDVVALVWQTDTGGTPNLFVRWRTFGRDGAPRMAVERTLAPRVDGEPVAAGAWMPDVAARDDGGFAVAGVWAAPAVERFQAFLQRFDGDGEPVGGFVTGPAEEGVSQLHAALTGAADGWYAAWSREPDSGAKSAVVARLPAGGEAFDAPLAATGNDTLVSSRFPTVAAAQVAGAPVFFAYTRQRVTVGGARMDVEVRDLRAAAVDEAAILTLGADDEQDHTPVVAAAPDGDGGLVVWFRTRAGIYNDVIAQRFRMEAGAFVTVGDAIVLNPPDAEGAHDAPAVYLPSVAALPDDVWLVAWSEGANPDFRIRGRYLTY